jgi:hypothetical protein
MSATLSTGILVFFAVVSVLSVALSIIRDKWLKELSFRVPLPLFKQFALFLLALGAMMALRGLFTDNAWTCELLFAAGALVPFVLKRFGVPSGPLGVILLLLVVGQTKFFPVPQTAANFSATMLGLGFYKILENIIFGLENSFDDVLPAFIWLVGAQLDSVKGVRENILLACLTIPILLRVLQAPYLSEDKSFIKRILLTAVGGLALLLLLTKVFLLPKMATLAGLFAAGLLFTYMFEPVGQSEEKQVIDPVRLLVLIGILTLGAMRLFGTFGLLVLASTTMVSSVSEGAVLAGMFFISRAIVQPFITQYNPNVTGVNLMHGYTSAALYGGMVIILLLSVALRDVENRWLAAAILLLACTILPPGLIYFLHEEPTCSFLIAATVAAVSIASLVPIFFKRQETSAQKNLILVPTVMITTSLLCGELVERGNQATATSRGQLALLIAVLALVVYGVFFFLNWTKTRGQIVDVPREQS